MRHASRQLAILAAALALCPVARAAEHITLANGFSLDCLRHEPLADTGKVRLYPIGAAATAESSSYIEVAANAIRLVETIPDPPPATFDAPRSLSSFAEGGGPASRPAASLTPVQTLLAQAGSQHHIDFDLLASLVHAESAEHATAVSRAGARGLMQLMPATAASLGVHDAFEPAQNIAGGTTYLDQLLTRYHDDIALALAAYNAGPGAVDRYHGVPPYRETRAYVTRIINEFNRRKTLALQAVNQRP